VFFEIRSLGGIVQMTSALFMGQIDQSIMIIVIGCFIALYISLFISKKSPRRTHQKMAGTGKINLIAAEAPRNEDDACWMNAAVMAMQSTNAFYYMIVFASKCLHSDFISTRLNAVESI
jgi:uncharacterized membrane protein